MKEILLTVITFLHILFVGFVVITPFIGSNYLLFIHSIIIPFLIFHWVCNDNMCALTLIEKKLRKEIYGTEDDNCITCQLIEPVYDFRKNYDQFTVLIYTVTIILWLISLGHLFYRYKNGKIDSWKDLFTM